MRYQTHIPQIRALTLACLVLLSGWLPARAMNHAAIDDVQAAMRIFLESLPKAGPIVVGVVYPSDVPDAQAMADATAQLIGSMRGANSRTPQPIVISTNDLPRLDTHLDVLFLIVGTSKHSALIMDTIRSHRLVGISDDPVCTDGQCCVITVSTGQRVEISLKSALADAVGARFSLIFTIGKRPKIAALDQRYRPFTDRTSELALGYQSKPLLRIIENMLWRST